MGLKIDAKDFLTNMSAIKQRSMFAAEKVGQNAAARMEGEAKRNARWTDRTGLARQTITGYSGWQGKKLRMGISGNMEYSAYLELGHEGRFAILWATVQANVQKIHGRLAEGGQIDGRMPAGNGTLDRIRHFDLQARRGDRQVPRAVCGRSGRRRICARYVRRGGNRLSDGDAVLFWCRAWAATCPLSWRRSGRQCAG